MRTLIVFTLIVIGTLVMDSHTKIILDSGDKSVVATLADTDAARLLQEELQKGSIVIDMSEYGGFEMVGELPWSLPATDRHMTTVPGDIMLYQGDNMVIFYGSNSWSYTPLGRIDDATAASVKEFLGNGSIKITISLDTDTGIGEISVDGNRKGDIYDLMGNKVENDYLSPGIYINNGKKFIFRK